MMQLARVMTVEEFYEFVNRPEHDLRCFELVEGRAIEWEASSRRHGFVCAKIGFTLCNYSRRVRKGNVALGGGGVILHRHPDTVRGPDVAYYDDALCLEDLPAIWGDLPPRLAVEVLMPGDRADYFLRKIADYLEHGVEVVWVLDPDSKRVAIYSKNEGVKSLGDKETITGGEVLPGFRCKVADFFVLPGSAKKAKRKRSP